MGARGEEQKKTRTQQGSVTPPTCRRDRLLQDRGPKEDECGRVEVDAC